MQTADSKQRAEMASVIRLAVLRMARRLRAQRVNATVTLSQLSALATVAKYGPMSAGEVAALEQVKPPSMTKILAALESVDFIKRSSHPEDRRQSVIVVSEAGKALLEDETRARDEWLAKRLTDLDESDVRKLIDAAHVLERLATE
jgi:DNA-binding MarR family transcriptional regulator